MTPPRVDGMEVRLDGGQNGKIGQRGQPKRRFLGPPAGRRQVFRVVQRQR